MSIARPDAPSVAWFVCFVLAGASTTLAGGERAERSVPELAKSSRASVVVIDAARRDGESSALGTGFVVRADGVIATNLHVIGQAGRPRVRFADDNKAYEAKAVLAYDRERDLALIQIERQGLSALSLADSSKLSIGEPIVAVGNPLGLEYSVVSGVLSGRPVVDGLAMLQLGMSIEQGNSGGPVLDRQGRVVGVVTLKSAVAERVGFAVPANYVQRLLENTYPIPMSHWVTIGALDPDEWSPLFGASWRQRAGRIIASGAGSGFGGRTLCLRKTPPPPDQMFEMAVAVKLDDESGAAGLAFRSDGGDKHYGFYPTNGKLRLTRFSGPDRFSWKILSEVESDSYRPGRWNTIKVRLDGKQITCFVNDTEVVRLEDDALPPGKDGSEGKVGLVKFRAPSAEFKHFRVARNLAPTAVSGELAEQIHAQVKKLSPSGPPVPEILDTLVPDADATLEVLRDRAHELEAEAFRLRHIADIVHQRRVQQELLDVLADDDSKIDLIHAALLVARLDNDDLQIDPYRWMVNRMAGEVRARWPMDADDGAKLQALTDYMFRELGYHGSRADYYHRSNSYLNEVLDDREGLPITLSVVFIELSRRLELPVVGVGLPTHFVVRYASRNGGARLLDVFNGATVMTEAMARELVMANTGQVLNDAHLAETSKRAIIVRMLHNLAGVAEREQDLLAVLRYFDTIILLDPEAPYARWRRGVLNLQTGQSAAARADFDWLLEHKPDGINLDEVRQLRNLLGTD